MLPVIRKVHKETEKHSQSLHTLAEWALNPHRFPFPRSQANKPLRHHWASLKSFILNKIHKIKLKTFPPRNKDTRIKSLHRGYVFFWWSGRYFDPANRESFTVQLSNYGTNDPSIHIQIEAHCTPNTQDFTATQSRILLLSCSPDTMTVSFMVSQKAFIVYWLRGTWKQERTALIWVQDREGKKKKKRSTGATEMNENATEREPSVLGACFTQSE